ncbi:hypothetical protein GCM10023321_13190 [Pseudonocardia eucalypti]|uniref:histidine kinase n=1 Tax=Pseudonocardia eucalypti TaxID=648755 RepID=A0ABP9PQP7_9PSEU|nr:signal transduction histidine kinase [Pseudonocardia eucalypti]
MGGTETGSMRLDRLLPTNWNLPVKLAAVLAVPIVLAMTLGVLRVAGDVDDATAIGHLDRYLAAGDRVSALVTDLQHERYQAAVFVAGARAGDQAPLRNAFAAVDARLADAKAMIGDASALGSGPRAVYQQITDQLSRLDALRGRVTDTRPDMPNGAANRADPLMVNHYTGLIGSMLMFEAALGRQTGTPVSAGLASEVTALAAAHEQISLQQAVIAGAITRGEMLPVDADMVRGSDARLFTAIDQLRIGAAGGRRELLKWTESAAVRKRVRLKQTALNEATPARAAAERKAPRNQLGVDRAEWDAAHDTELADLRGTEAGVRAEIKANGLERQERARSAAGINSVILLLGLLTTAAVVYLIGKSILNPLRILRGTALEVANRRLPEAVRRMREGKAPDSAVTPVPVAGRTEVGQVARAFDKVHKQAVRLAAEQAALQNNVSGMFVNLSRRSQSLIERQLRLIEQLERNEQDSEQLANLFQLDHLATRMRRNSDNLLVLAGSELTQRMHQVVPVVDVLRAAVSEIEQYKRVVVQPPPDARILGRTASDLVHLVAELLDNATNFSAPDTRVLVNSTRNTDGSVLLEISDEGVGMSPKELAAANRRLSGTVSMDVSTSRRMGLFVVGRLAARHSIRVRLASAHTTDNKQSGTTAYVHVLANLVVAPAATTDPPPTQEHRPEGSEQPRKAAQTQNGTHTADRKPAETRTARPARTAVNGSGVHMALRPALRVDQALPERRKRAPQRPQPVPVNAPDPIVAPDPPSMPSPVHTEPAASPPEPSETPIYTRMESAWFRSAGREAPDPLTPQPTRSGTNGAEPAAATVLGSAEADDPGQARNGATPEQRSPEWGASHALHPMPEAPPSGLTDSGLPKRKPGSQLIPRGAHAPTDAKPREAPARRAEQVRSQLTSYQKGLRQGRAGHRKPEQAESVHVPPHPRGAQS